jgi:hypothetical protein
MGRRTSRMLFIIMLYFKKHFYFWRCEMFYRSSFIGLSLLICIAVFSSLGLTQEGVTVTWEKTFGGGGWDMAVSMEKTSDQCYILAGETRSYGSEGDIYVLKIDEMGNLIWEKNFGGTDYDYAESIIETSDRGYAIVGMTNSFGAIEEDIYLLKLDVDGNLIWEKRFGGKGYDEAFSIKETSDGGYIICGGTNPSPEEDFDIYLLRLNRDGEMIWEKTIGGDDEEMGRVVLLTSDGGFLVLAYKGSEEDRDIYLLKLNKDGNILWEKILDIDISVFPISMNKISDGGYIFSGYTGIADAYSAYVAKLDEEGNLIWDKTLGGSGWDVAIGVKETTDRCYIVVGRTNAPESEGTDVWILKLDVDGNLIKEKTYGGGQDDVGASVCETSDGEYIIAGQTTSFGAGESDVYVLKVDF